MKKHPHLRSFPRTAALILSGSIAALLVSQSAHAATLTWDTIINGAPIDASSGTWDLAGSVWNNAGSNVAWTQTNATTPTNAAVFAGADGTYAITVGTALATQGLTFNNSSYTLSAASAQTITDTGTITIASGKTATIGSNVTVSRSSGQAIQGGGILNLTGGAVVGTGPEVTGGTTVNVQSGGSFTSTSQFFIGTNLATANTNNDGTLNVTGGTVSSTGNGMALGSLVTAGKTTNATLTISSGSITAGASGAQLGFGNRFGAVLGTVNGVINLDGGTITAPRVQEYAVSGAGVINSTFNFNGGTLKVATTGQNSTFFQGIDNANVKSGGATIDTNGVSVTVAQVLQHDAALGATADGGLTKNSTGTLTLTGANTYTGNTTIRAGTLKLDLSGSISNSANIIVGDAGSSGAILDVTTKTGGLSIGLAQTLSGIGQVNGNTIVLGTHAPGNSPGLQTFNGNLAYSTGSMVNWELATNSVGTRGTHFDAIDVTGTGGLTIGTGVTSKLIFNAFGSGVLWSNGFWTSNHGWLVFSGADAVTGIFDTINVSQDSIGAVLTVGSFSWGTVGNDVYLNYTTSAVPEPTGVAVGLLCLGVATLRRRRRSPLEG